MLPGMDVESFQVFKLVSGFVVSKLLSVEIISPLILGRGEVPSVLERHAWPAQSDLLVRSVYIQGVKKSTRKRYRSGFATSGLSCKQQVPDYKDR